ncbi:hypothetical protein HAZT_HAZT011214 [Hyalella azteca]|uniref:Uncharacterized protein n=1 Tax=Hyalella azteca TaxID=294128 RepID=A0A6A0H3I2_HYAAZ|nr:hypothetical protein HAZT_HAZT011214 [Hyalella azteca]
MWSSVTGSVGPGGVGADAVPGARHKHAVCCCPPSVFLLAGRHGNFPLKDFWCYDLGEHGNFPLKDFWCYDLGE